MGMDPVLPFGLPRTFRGASANVVCPDMLFGLLARMVKAQEDMLLKTF